MEDWESENTDRVRRQERLREMKRIRQEQERRRQKVRKLVPLVLAGVVCLVLVFTGIHTIAGTGAKQSLAQEAGVSKNGLSLKQAAASVSQIRNSDASAAAQTQETAATQATGETSQTAAETAETSSQDGIYQAKATKDTATIDPEVVSSHAILVDLSNNTILAQRDAESRISPASMTKILTVLVAAEHVKNLDDKVTITLQDTDFSYSNDCSNVGFAENEVVSVRDLFYGTILSSGADAASALARYTAGSQEEFVRLMNAKLDELGLSDTAHFTNCVGIYDENHYCTAYDMAMILNAAIHNDWCKQVLSTHTYTTSLTTQHPEGIIISNWFLRRIEDKDCGGTVVCGKTGFVVQSGNCAASFAIDPEGKGYICVTGNSTSAWRCIYDHVAIYKKYL